MVGEEGNIGLTQTVYRPRIDLLNARGAKGIFPYGDVLIDCVAGKFNIPRGTPTLEGYSSCFIPVSTPYLAPLALKFPVNLEEVRVQRFNTEVEIMRDIRPLLSPRLLANGTIEINDQRIPWSLIEYLEGKILNKVVLPRSKTNFNNYHRTAKQIVQCCVESLRRLHANGYVFGDSLVNNVMVDLSNDGIPNGNARVFDFGNAVKVTGSLTIGSEQGTKDIMRILQVLTDRQTFVGRTLRHSIGGNGDSSPVEFASNIQYRIVQDADLSTVGILEDIEFFAKSLAGTHSA